MSRDPSRLRATFSRSIWRGNCGLSSREIPSPPYATVSAGPDLVQVVLTPSGVECGTILWEAKNARTWAGSWPGKLKQDMRDAGADIGVLISVCTPEHVGLLTHLDGFVWVARPSAVAALAAVLRQSLRHAHAVVQLALDNGKRVVALHQYFTSPEFRQWLEACHDYIREDEDDMVAERRWFTSRWARRKKRNRAILITLSRLSGHLEGLGPTRLGGSPAIGELAQGDASVLGAAQNDRAGSRRLTFQLDA